MNKKKFTAGKMDMDTLDSIIAQILTQASGDDEVFQAFGQLIKDTVNLPADGFVIGEPIVITAIEYSGNARRGLTAACRREDGSDHVIALSEVMFPRARLSPSTPKSSGAMAVIPIFQGKLHLPGWMCRR